MFIIKRLRETEHEHGRGRKRGRHRIRAGSRLWAISTEPDTGLELTNHEIMAWAEVWHLTDWATQVPLCVFIFNWMGWILRGGINGMKSIYLKFSYLKQDCFPKDCNTSYYTAILWGKSLNHSQAVEGGCEPDKSTYLLNYTLFSMDHWSKNRKQGWKQN